MYMFSVYVQNWNKRVAFMMFLYGSGFATLRSSVENVAAVPPRGIVTSFLFLRIYDTWLMPFGGTDGFPEGVPYALCAVFHCHDLVRIVMKFV